MSRKQYMARPTDNGDESVRFAEHSDNAMTNVITNTVLEEDNSVYVHL